MSVFINIIGKNKESLRQDWREHKTYADDCRNGIGKSCSCIISV